MAYTHGVIVNEIPTSITAPVQVDSAVIVALGTAPVNTADITTATEPKIAYTLAEAKSKVGYVRREDYTLNQVTKAAFELFGVAPVIYINALNPAKHKKQVTEEISMINGKAILEMTGILLDSLELSSSGENGPSQQYEPEKDYLAAFDDDGQVVIAAVEGGSLSASGELTIAVKCNQLDPSMVKKADILTAIDLLDEIYPRFGVVPGVLIAPGWSHEPDVYNKMVMKTKKLNSLFSSIAIADVNMTKSATYDKVYQWKNDNGYTDPNSVVCWPAARVGDSVIAMSAIAAGIIALTDSNNEGVPYVSPSNKAIPIQGICDEDGNEIILDYTAANLLNGQGICTAINMNGWQFWGNRTACYPGNTDLKDSFIPMRRMFAWWSNTFILTYFQRVDDPMNPRLIEAVVDSENIRANGFKSRFQIADAKMVYLEDENPTTDLLNGIIRFRQYLTLFPPAETIINDLEFDPDALVKALAIE